MKLRHLNGVCLGVLLILGYSALSEDEVRQVDDRTLAVRAIDTSFENKMVKWMGELADVHALVKAGAPDEALPLIRALDQDVLNEPIEMGLDERAIYKLLVRATQEERAMMRALRYGNAEEVKQHHDDSIRYFKQFRNDFAEWMGETK